MICPLKLTAGYSSPCCGESCALYDEILDSCLIRTWIVSQIESAPVQITKPNRIKEESKLD